MNLHTIRSGGFSGIAFVVVVAVAFFATGMLPDNSAPASAISAYFDAHRVGLLVAGWLNVPAVAFFVWYAVGLYRWLAAAGTDEGLPLFALINGVIASVIALVTGGIQIALAFHPSSDLGPQVSRALYDLLGVSGALTFGSVAFFIFGAARSGARHQSLPGWLCWFGYLFALGNLASSVTSMYNAGPMVLGGLGGLILGVLPLLAWMVLSACVMIGKGASAAAR